MEITSYTRLLTIHYNFQRIEMTSLHDATLISVPLIETIQKSFSKIKNKQAVCLDESSV